MTPVQSVVIFVIIVNHDENHDVSNPFVMKFVMNLQHHNFSHVVVVIFITNYLAYICRT